jgi:type IV secretion system protein VirB4
MRRSIFEELKISKNYAKNQKIMRQEVQSSSFLHYSTHYDSTTVVLKNGYMMKTVKMNGFSFETADDEDVDIRKEMRNQFVRGLPEKIKLYSHTIRRKQEAFTSDFGAKRTGNLFSDYANRIVKSKLASSDNYSNELYLTVLIKAETKAKKFVDLLFDFFGKKKKDDESKAAVELKETVNELEEIINRLLVGFRDYSPRVLSLYKNQYGILCSEVLEFLGLIGNFELQQMAITENSLSKQIFKNRLYFKRKHIEMLTNTGKKYAGIISLKEYNQQTDAGFFDAFLQLPCEMIITQSYQTSNRQGAIGKMQLQQDRMIQAGDKAISQVYEITRALDDAMSGRIGFGKHHMTVMCIDKTLKSLENSISMAEVEMMNTGVYTVREKWNMEPSYWAQFPGNFDYSVRQATINSKNFAGMASFHNYPTGKKFGNHWGEAVTVLNTTSKTPLYFNFHVRDIGHTMIVGPTGAGKTVLMNFLCCQAMKYNPKMFFFDKDRGAEIFLRAIGGRYTIIEAKSSAGFNPLQMEDTHQNRTFLIEWLRQLASAIDKKITPDDIALISSAVDGNFKLKKEDRKLSNIAPFFGMNTPGSLASRMTMWYGKGSHGTLFDNDEDKLNLSEARIYGFEMGPLLKDPISLGPVLMYLFHRINLSLNGEPTMIILDEAWALIDNDTFAPTIKDWLKVLRKLNAMVVFATQSVEDIGKSQISDTLVQQTATQIFLPNLKATAIYKTIFMLSKREFSLIKTTDPSSRYFLVKQGINAVIAKLDLKGMDDVINVLSGRAETVLMLEEIRKKVGENPRDWLPLFYEKVKHVKAS